MLAFGSAFVGELLDETFHSPRQLQTFTEYQVLATIPLQKSKQRDLSFERVLTSEDEREQEFENDLNEKFSRDLYKRGIPVLATIRSQQSKNRNSNFDPIIIPVDEEESELEKDDLDESFIRHFYNGKVQIQYQED